MHRIISELQSAKALPARPGCIPAGRPRGVKRTGILYEKAVFAALPASFGAKRGLWFEFLDANGRGYCSPDIVFRAEGAGSALLVILECKLTYTTEAQSQLHGLYRPTVGQAFGSEVHTIVVCKHLTPSTPRSLIQTSLSGALSARSNGVSPILHWLGRGPI